MLDARRGRGFAALDLDHRPSFWPGEQAAHDAVRDVLGWVTLAVGNLEECQMAVGATEPDRAANALLEAGVEPAVIKRGPHGVLGKTREERVVVASTVIQVVNGLGAGDGFGGALCHGLLEGWSLHRTLEFASAAGAIGASRLECSGAVPTGADVEALIAERRMVQGEA